MDAALAAQKGDNMEFTKIEYVSLKNHPELNEKWVQDRIAEDPSIVGLGDVILRDRERIQPRAGRLDLLLQDADSSGRYEVEIQLGATDESHIIRTIEYWDIERKRFQQYEHTAVIIAEDITSRFLNVISLFNGQIPLIAIQMKAIKIDNKIGLAFTTVLNQAEIGFEDDDEISQETTDRNYWESRGSKRTVSMADELLELARKHDNGLQLKYNKFYIGLSKNGIASNFISFRPKKEFMRLEARLNLEPDIAEKLESAGLDVMEYDKRWNRSRVRLQYEDIKKHQEIICWLIEEAYKRSVKE